MMRSAMTLMLLALAAATPAYAAPNFVVIMTDDQDDTGSIDTMPAVQRLAQEGITFTNSFVNFSLCSPSRSSFFTGQAESSTTRSTICAMRPMRRSAMLRDLHDRLKSCVGEGCWVP